MTKYLIQLLLGIIVLFTSILISWYEGSAIIESSLEWKYSTPFTQFFNIDVITGKEILYIDYFYYSLKVNPIYVCVAFISFVYIISVISLINIKFKFVSVRVSFVVLVLLSSVLLVISALFAFSSTSKVFSLVSFVCLLGVISLYVMLKKYKYRYV
jgi:Domain of unknown function (DUF4306)